MLLPFDGGSVCSYRIWFKSGKHERSEEHVNNGEQLDVMPLVGDFNFYGGIYRDVCIRRGQADGVARRRRGLQSSCHIIEAPILPVNSIAI